MPPSISLLSQRSKVEPYIASIRRAADGEKDAFGFLPAKAYDEFVYQERVIIAIDRASDALVGYTLFGGALPQGRIFQTWASPDYRGRGVGRRLLTKVIGYFENSAYLSVRADVASDLVAANAFYEELGFEIIRTKQGGKTRGRTINIRVRELSTPSLLDLVVDESDGLTPLPVELQTPSGVPLYVLDLNVIFDVTKQRPRAAAASRVMAAAFENYVRLSITEELVSELERHTIPGSTDPVLALARTLPRLPLPPRSLRDKYIDELAPIVFPERTRAGKLTTQDRSDLAHLVTAIHECAEGFITSERAILKAANPLKLKYGLDILSPEAFSPNQDSDYELGMNVSAVSGTTQLDASTMLDQDYGDVEVLMKRAHATPEQVRVMLSRGTATYPRRRYVVRAGGALTAVGAWDCPGLNLPYRRVTIWADESQPFALLSVEHLIGRLEADLGGSRPSVFRLTTSANQPTVRRAAISGGFFRAEGEGPRSRKLTKIALGHPLTPENWNTYGEAIKTRSGICLPSEPPMFTTTAQPVELRNERGKTASLSLAEVERLLSPTLIILANRPAVVLPITQAYAEELFRGSSQPSLLAGREAVLRKVRGYIGSATTFRVIRDGAIIVFYESSTGGGRSAATAVARITRRYLMDKRSASQYASSNAVLEGNVIQGMGSGIEVCVSEFDNLMLFRKPVSLATLRAIGCADGANFVTAKAISSDHLMAIVSAGDPHG